MKFIYIDVETTGIECPESGLVQLAGEIEVDGDIIERFEYKIRPFPKDLISGEALEVNGMSREDLRQYNDPSEVFEEFIGILGKYVDRYDRSDKFLFVGYNAQFDADHLRAWFEKNGDRYFGSWFWHPPLDVMGMASIALMNKRHGLKNFRLTTVAAALGFKVDEGKAHDALYDVCLTKKLFHHLLKQIDIL